MAKCSKKGRERKAGLVMLKLMMKKLQRSLSPSNKLEAAETMVRDDVKEGHFAVFAVEGGEAKRFVLELGYLSNPEFLRLLELAEEEFGFEQEGTLAVPCRPDELQRILQSNMKKES